MPTTPTYAFRYPAPADPANVPADMQKLALDVEAISVRTSYGASPPVAPASGDIWYYPISTGGVWQFRYNASGGSYKWEFVGGAPTGGTVATNETTGSTAPIDLATQGPSFTLPRDGDYLFSWGADVANSAAGNNTSTSLMVNGVVRAGAGFVSSIAGAAYLARVSRSLTVAGLPASSGRLMYSASGGVGTFANRDVQVTPIRVG